MAALLGLTLILAFSSLPSARSADTSLLEVLISAAFLLLIMLKRCGVAGKQEKNTVNREDKREANPTGAFSYH